MYFIFTLLSVITLFFIFCEQFQCVRSLEDNQMRKYRRIMKMKKYENLCENESNR